MLRTAASVLIAMSISVLPSSPAGAGYCGPGYDCYVYPDPCGYRGDCDRKYGYRAGAYRSVYDAPRFYGAADRPPRMAPYYVNGCYNGRSADGVYCYYRYRCPYYGYRY